jgi:ABC-2 type transport system ATP-binding protein
VDKMIEVKNLTKIYRSHLREKNLIKDLFFRRYKETIALDQVSFQIKKNEFVGFIGPNGAGKTTTMKILSGILYPTNGEVSVLGYFPFDKKKEFLRQISFVMGQRNQLFWDLPALDSFQLIKEIYEIDDNQFKKNLDNLTYLLNCSNLINQPVKTLSLGERMKMELIAALVYDPKIIFLDEPTIGLDIFSQEALRNFLKTYQKEFKKTIILTSHYLEDVKRLVKRLIVINKGKIIYDGALSEVVHHYSRTKKIRLTLEEEIDEKIKKEFNIVFDQFPQLTIETEKDQIPSVLEQIIKKIPYSDIVIEDESIETIIKKILKI